MASSSRRLAAVLFADIVGYTSLSARDENIALEQVRLFQALTRDAVSKAAGNLIKFVGDGALAEFPSTEAALRAALWLRAEFGSESLGVGAAGELRIGVHVGDILVTADGDVFGHGVNTASRLQRAADAGQIVVGAELREQMAGRLEFSFAPLGKRRLRGLSEYAVLYSVTAAGDDRTSQKLAAAIETSENTARGPSGVWTGPSGWRSRRWVRVGAIGVCLLGLVAAGLWTSSRLISPPASLMATGAIEPSDEIIVAEFENRTADAGLGRTISQALAVDLSQSRIVRVLEPTEVAEAVQRTGRDPASTILAGPLAREIAQREGVKAIVDGSVGSVGTATLINARLVSAREGRVLAEVSARAAGPEDLIHALDSVTDDLRDRMGESLSVIRADPSLEQVTTHSLDALRLYVDGRRERYETGDPQRAAVFFEQAVALDSMFAAAWANLGLVSSGAARDSAMSKAFALRNRLTGRERAYVTGLYFTLVTEDNRRATAAYDAVVSAYPDDPILLNNAGLAYWRLRNFAAAEDAFRRSIALGPDRSPNPHSNLAAMLSSQGRHDEAAALLDAAIDNWPYLESFKPRFAIARGDVAAAEALLRERLHSAGSDLLLRAQLSSQLASILAMQGRISESERLLGQAARANEQRGDTRSALINQMDAVRVRSIHSRENVSLITDALRAHPFERIPRPARPYLTVAIAYATYGGVAEARRLVQRAQAEEITENSSGLRHYALGLLALANGQPEDAVRRLESAVSGLCEICRFYDLARAQEAAGDIAGAIESYESFLTRPDGIGRLSTLPAWFGPAHERLSELYERSGDRQNAAAHAEALVALWAEADPDLQPRVAKAKERAERLTSD